MNIQRMMVVMAHLDDVEINCYGTIRKIIEKGAKCYVVIATNGENGFANGKMKDSLIRKKETENSLYNLVDEIIWLEKKMDMYY